MAASERWYFGIEQIHSTPSSKCGYDHDKELSCRQQAANFIQDMGQRLQVTQLCINTAIVYMHRFYMFHSFTKFHRTHLASAALFLAAKVEEQPRKLEHVIRVAQICLHREHPPFDVKSEAYNEAAQDLIMNENILLQTLGFDVAIDHPHTHIVRCCQLVRASKDLAQTSYFMASYSLHLTTMCLQYKPTVVACFCIHLACKWSNWEIPESSEGKPWFWYVDKSVTSELLEHLTTEFLSLFEKCPSRLKKKIMSLSYQHMPSTPNTSTPQVSFNLTPQQQQELDKRKENNRIAIESHIPPNAQHPITSATSSTSLVNSTHSGTHGYMQPMGGHHSSSGSSTTSSGSSGMSVDDHHKKRAEQHRLNAQPPAPIKKHHHPTSHHSRGESHGAVPVTKSSCMYSAQPQQATSAIQTQKTGYHNSNNAVHSSASNVASGQTSTSSVGHPTASVNSSNSSSHNISNSGLNSSNSNRYHNMLVDHNQATTATPSSITASNNRISGGSRPAHVRNGEAHFPSKKYDVKSEPVETKQPLPPPMPPPHRPKTPPQLPPPSQPIKQERSIFSPEEKVSSPPQTVEIIKPVSPPPTPRTPIHVKHENSGSDSEPPTESKPNGEQPRVEEPPSPSRSHKKKKKKHKDHKDKHKDKHKHKHKAKDPEPIVITIPKEKITITQPEGLKIKIAKDKISPTTTGLKIKISKDKLKESKKRERSEESEGAVEQASKHHRPNGTTLQVNINKSYNYSDNRTKPPINCLDHKVSYDGTQGKALLSPIRTPAHFPISKQFLSPCPPPPRTPSPTAPDSPITSPQHITKLSPISTPAHFGQTSPVLMPAPNINYVKAKLLEPPESPMFEFASPPEDRPEPPKTPEKRESPNTTEAMPFITPMHATLSPINTPLHMVSPTHKSPQTNSVRVGPQTPPRSPLSFTCHSYLLNPITPLRPDNDTFVFKDANDNHTKVGSLNGKPRPRYSPTHKNYSRPPLLPTYPKPPVQFSAQFRHRFPVPDVRGCFPRPRMPYKYYGERGGYRGAQRVRRVAAWDQTRMPLFRGFPPPFRHVFVPSYPPPPPLPEEPPPPLPPPPPPS